MDTSPRLSLPYLLPNQAQKHVTLNDTLRRLDLLVQMAVLSCAQVAAPAAPDDGDTYILPEGATGPGWDGAPAGSLAVWQDGSWVIFAPSDGWQAFDLERGDLLVRQDGLWHAIASRAIALLGVNTTADAAHRLSVKSDAELLSHDDITPGSGDARKFINKAGAGNTASVVFQAGFNGHAEIGLAGGNDLHVKVSSDGSTWREAAVVSNATGYIGFGTQAPTAPVMIDTRAYAGLSAGAAGLIVTGTSGAERAEFRSIGPGPNAAFQGFGARGTPEAPEPTLDGDRLFAILGSGFDGTSLIVPLAVQIDMRAEGDWSAANHAAFLSFTTTPPGETVATRQERMRITAAGRVGIGTTAPTCRLHVEGPVRVGGHTVASLPPAAAAGAGALAYVSDASGGAVMAFSDGTDWRRVTDRTVVS